MRSGWRSAGVLFIFREIADEENIGFLSFMRDYTKSFVSIHVAVFLLFLIVRYLRIPLRIISKVE